MKNNTSMVIHAQNEKLNRYNSIINNPSTGEVQIEVQRAGVSLGEVTKATTNLESIKYPWTPGFDVVGTVCEIGKDVQSLIKGQRVASLTMYGGYTKYINVPQNLVTVIPDEVSSNSASAIITNYLTAYQMITRAGKVKPGIKVLIHGAAGGLGSALLDLSSFMGLKAYCTVSSKKVDFIKEKGGIPIDYKKKDFVKVIKELEPTGLDVVFETIGLDNAKKSLKCLKSRGQLVLSGFTELVNKKVTKASLLLKFLAIKAKSIGKKTIFFRADPIKQNKWYKEDVTILFQLAQLELIKPTIDSVYNYHDANSAFTKIKQAQNIGKIILNFD